METHQPYLPLNELKPVAADIWIVDGPEIGMKFPIGTMPFPTRMTVVRLPDGKIWIHSPIAWSDDLGAAVAALGPITFLVAPNTLHYWYLPDWQAHFADARSYGAPDVETRARRPLRLDETLTETVPAAWSGIFDQCLVRGKLLTEVAFFHRPSRTLILTDLIENFEPNRIRKTWLRWAVKIAGAADPDGKAPIDMRLNFAGHRKPLREAVQRMVNWAPERIILAHGRYYERDAVNELRRAFRWIL